ncbi:MAG: glycosyltransferase [Candidatus Obscuribacterales bacterium]|nr:glycosyltransferase [Steroidobacteraceae bacterium]
MAIFFWICVLLVAYPYAIYPLILIVATRLMGRGEHVAGVSHEPTLTIILPVHNEANRIASKVRNLLELDYPRDKLQILVIGDACTDDTLNRAKAAGGGIVEVVPLKTRAGKAAGLNAGLERATGEVLVFTDAGIILERQSLRRLVAHFSDPAVGCVSGEDYIEGADSEGLYGRLELLLRREEAKLHSIAGASGCFYAQRRTLCKPFKAGMAPDFLSVLVTVRSGARALAEPAARGAMTATSSQSAEFTRKVRTFLRGITALFGNVALLNPLAFPGFSFILWSHKLMRWLAPLPMMGCIVAALFLKHEPLYYWLLIAQLALYASAIAGLLWPQLAARLSVIRLSAFFVLVNVAALKALALWLTGTRLEVWQPTRRPE